MLVASGDLPHIHEAYARIAAEEFGPVGEWPGPVVVDKKEQFLLTAKTAIDTALNELAQSWTYKSFPELITYAFSTNAAWSREARLAIAYRDTLETILYSRLSQDDLAIADFMESVKKEKPTRNLQ